MSTDNESLKKMLYEACSWIDTSLTCESYPPLSSGKQSDISGELVTWWRENCGEAIKRRDEKARLADEKKRKATAKIAELQAEIERLRNEG